MLTNPAVLAGAAGIMAQLAMQQSMDEVTDYLVKIDAKIDDVLRAQEHAVLADMIGVDFVLEEAMTIREQVGRVSEVTWSKVQSTAFTVARTQAYALAQLRTIAEKLESTDRIGDLAYASRAAEAKVQDWLTVIARCSQLQDGISVLELDRLLDSAPEELDRHRLALRSARENRLSLISEQTTRLLARMIAAVHEADDEVLLHPLSASAVGRSSAQIASEIVQFHEGLGIEGGSADLTLRRWRQAAAELRDTAVDAVGGGVTSAVRAGGDGVGQAKATIERVVDAIAKRWKGPDGGKRS